MQKGRDDRLNLLCAMPDDREFIAITIHCGL